MEENMVKLREKIDKIDGKIIVLLKKRFEIAVKLGSTRN